MVDINTKIFNSIKNFVSSLDECYSDNFNNIKLYNNLLQKTTYSHTELIKKHIDIFRVFSLENESCILNKNYELTQPKLQFSHSIFIDLNEVLKTCDNSEKETIWKHVALIYSYFKPNSNIKHMLKQKKTNESSFIKDMIDKVEDSIDGGNVNNPMEAITKMMTSGVFSELVGSMTNGLQSGELNIGGLLGSVNEMVETMNVPDINKPEDKSEDNKLEDNKSEDRKRRINKKRKKLRRK